MLFDFGETEKSLIDEIYQISLHTKLLVFWLKKYLLCKSPSACSVHFKGDEKQFI